MAKEFFKDLPDTSTPLSATRINGLLDGEESMGSIVVEDIKSKNLFDKNDCVDHYYLDYNSGQPVYDVNMAYMNSYIPVKANEKYTMSYSSSTIFVVYEYDSNKTFLRNKRQNTDATSFTVTISEDTSFIRLACGFSVKSGIQFEKGDKATPFTPYKKIGYNETDWQDITYANTYSNYDENSYNKLQYKKINNQVFLRGMITNSVANPQGYYASCGFLPRECRPQKPVYFIINENGTSTNCSIEKEGGIRVFNKTANSWIALDGINFFIY